MIQLSTDSSLININSNQMNLAVIHHQLPQEKSYKLLNIVQMKFHIKVVVLFIKRLMTNYFTNMIV